MDAITPWKPEKPRYSVPEAAEIWGYGYSTVNRLIRDEKIRAVRDPNSRRVFITAAEIQRVLRQAEKRQGRAA